MQQNPGRPVHVVLACYLGWTLDAFDFFIMALVLEDVAREFGTTRTAATLAITLTLAMRPLGALIFGRIADRYGRRPTLMANVIAYSILAFASGLAPNLAWFIGIRALFGVAMGGEWGVGASLTMESIPASWRGPVSGLLQAGYPSGFLLATLVYRAGFSDLGWRGMFMVGAIPALLVLYIRRHVPESPDWLGRRARSGRDVGGLILADMAAHWRRALFAVAMMTAFTFFSHGTQDIYPSFLRTEHHLTPNSVAIILVLMNVAAILGGIGCGALSQRFGRRRTIVLAALCALPIVPLWAFASGAVWIGVGACLIQLCVQGAWGVVPAHLNELAPPSLRATFPGLTYQLGNLLAAATVTIQSGMADRYFAGSLQWPLAIVVGSVAVVIVIVVGLGPEARGTIMYGDAQR